MEAMMARYDDVEAFRREVPVHPEKNKRVTLSFNDVSEKTVTSSRLTVEQKAEQDRREIEWINKNADKLNAEAMDALQYQVDLF
jgi:hypothetical protein